MEHADTTVDAVLERFGQARILVLGDLWLEHVLRAETSHDADAAKSRSGAAPSAAADGTLQLRASQRTTRAGGAGAVACSVAALGARTWVAGILGPDPAAGELLRALSAAGVDGFGIVSNPAHHTAETLVLTVAAQVALPWSSIAIEICAPPPLSGSTASEMLDHIEPLLAQVDAIAIVAHGSPIPAETLDKLRRLTLGRGKLVVGAIIGVSLPSLAELVAALPSCDIAVLGPPAADQALNSTDAPHRLLPEMSAKALVVISREWGVALHTDAAKPRSGAAPEFGRGSRSSPERREASPELIIEPKRLGAGAWAPLVAALVVAAAVGAEAPVAARIGAAAALSAAQSGGGLTVDELRRALADI